MKKFFLLVSALAIHTVNVSQKLDNNLSAGNDQGYRKKSSSPRNTQSQSQEIYNSQTGIYAAKPGASVANVNQTPTAEPNSTIGPNQGAKGLEARENTGRYSRVFNASNPARFTRIKADPEVASNEIDFWARQMSEHALFLYLGIVDEALKQEAFSLHTAFENFRTNFNQNPHDFELMNQILPLLEKERAYQITVLKTLDAGTWIGWIFPLFVNHITLELDYFTDKLNAIKYSPTDEVLFWNRVNAEHASFAAHLLDPQERKLFLQADKLSESFKDIPKSEKEMMVKISLIASKELDKFSKNTRTKLKQIKSIIHPVLIDHVIREGKRSIKTLESLGLSKESKRIARLYADQIEQYEE